jgi:repressor LexA
MPGFTVHDGGKWGDDLSARQRAILDFFREWLDTNGVPPTYREIGHAMGIRSTNGVSDHVKALLRKGYLNRVGEGSRARSLVLTDKALAAGPQTPERALDDMVEVGVFGRVAAGMPLLAEENREETLHVDSVLLPGAQRVFALRVTGESMIDDGIFDGDYIFVRKQLQVNDGDIAVVMVDEEATVKRFYREPRADGGFRVRLQPANETMSPIYVDAEDFREVNILGIVVGVYRKLG